MQERVHEEKTDRIEHEAETPAEDVAYRFPSIDLLDDAGEDAHRIDYDELEENKRILLDKLETYKIEITDINAIVGPTVTLYELTPAPGIKISRITALEDDLAMAMAARGIRMIAPHPRQERHRRRDPEPEPRIGRPPRRDRDGEVLRDEDGAPGPDREDDRGRGVPRRPGQDAAPLDRGGDGVGEVGRPSTPSSSASSTGATRRTSSSS